MKDATKMVAVLASRSPNSSYTLIYFAAAKTTVTWLVVSLFTAKLSFPVNVRTWPCLV